MRSLTAQWSPQKGKGAIDAAKRPSDWLAILLNIFAAGKAGLCRTSHCHSLLTTFFQRRRQAGESCSDWHARRISEYISASPSFTVQQSLQSKPRAMSVQTAPSPATAGEGKTSASEKVEAQANGIAAVPSTYAVRPSLSPGERRQVGNVGRRFAYAIVGCRGGIRRNHVSDFHGRAPPSASRPSRRSETAPRPARLRRTRTTRIR